MKFELTEKKELTVLTISERKIDATVSAELKAEFLVICKRKGLKKLVVDLASVEFCDSSGLAALLIAHRATNAAGGTVHLVKPQKKILDLLRLSQLERLFFVNKTVAEASAA